MSTLSSIPGISIVPANENENSIAIPSFDGTAFIPGSHRYGNCLRISEIDLLGAIHEGSFGTIYKCRNKKTSRVYALKKFKINSADMLYGVSSRILREINILSTFKHDNIANSHGMVAGDNVSTSNYLLMDYCIASLDHVLKKEEPAIYEAEMVKCIMKQLLEGLEFIHENMIIHGDINCRNVLFTENGLVKISGFQTTRYCTLGSSMKLPEVTEPSYTAPEILFEANIYGTPVDIWSAGCVFSRLLLKKNVFSGSDSAEVLVSMFDVLGTPSDAIWPNFTKRYLDNGQKIINGGQPYTDLANTFADQCLASTEIIRDILSYYPPSRKSASELLKNVYFNDAFQDSALLKLALILRNLVQPTVPMDIGV